MTVGFSGARKSILKAVERDSSNLLLACSYCNGFKSAHLPLKLSTSDDMDAVIYTKKTTPSERALIDLADEGDDNSLAHITFNIDNTSKLFGLAIAKDASSRGQTTIDITGIDRVYWTNQRSLHLIEVSKAHLEVLKEITHTTAKEHIARLQRKLEVLTDMSHPTRKFSAAAKVYIDNSKIVSLTETRIQKLSV
ncbi:hypothetical protein N9W89_12120 [Hellea sp.]|nr:hypothetical protein [Hellea sp.]